MTKLSPLLPILLVSASLLSGCGQSIWKTAGPRVGPLRDDREKLSYAIGVTVGEQWKTAKTDIDPKSASRGMAEAFGGSVTPERAKQLTKQLSDYQKSKRIADADEAPPAPVNDVAVNLSRDQISYALGVNLGMAWRGMRMDIDPGSVDRGLNDIFSGQTLQVSPDEAKDIVAAYGEKYAADLAEARRQLALKNKADAEAFLAANRSKSGVVELPTGLQYKVLTPGNGDSPDYDGWVNVRYRGTLLDGTEVENSNRYGDPFVVSPRGVPEGMSEALQMMKPGAVWELYVPAKLAYGEEGGVGVGPNAALIYHLELVSVLPGRPQPTPAQAREMNKD